MKVQRVWHPSGAKGHGFAAGCVEGLCKKVVKKVLKMDRPYGPEGS